MDNPVKEVRINRNTVVKIYYDDNLVDTPRDWSNVGSIASWHRNYELNNKSDAEYDEWGIKNYKGSDFIAHLGGYNEDYSLSDKENEKARAKAFNKAKKEYVILPIYMYEHSGVWLNTGGFSYPWDSGQVGYIYVSKKRAMEEMGIKRWGARAIERVKDTLRAEIETLSDYMEGNVYGYVLEKSGEHEDSCWGFYGSSMVDNGLIDIVPLGPRQLITLARGLNVEEKYRAQMKKRKAARARQERRQKQAI